MKKSIINFNKMKQAGEPITWVTAYSYPFANAVENAGIEMILVGDSGGMVELGYQTTNPVTMDEMISFAKAVRRGAPNTFIVGDMPQGAYEISKEEAVKNAIRFAKEATCDAIKLEGGKRVADKIKAIVDAGILVIGHLGLTPQSTVSFGGYRVQGKTVESFEEMMEDSIEIEKAGCSMLLLEAVPDAVAQQIAKKLKIPVMGIGAGKNVDGQLIIMHDLAGFYPNFRPWFAKCYIPEALNTLQTELATQQNVKKYGIDTRNDGVLRLMQIALKNYYNEVKGKVYPSEEYIYPIKLEELASIKKSLYWTE
jgi:3-methyl-2-oxobutanoate hydroxymethyltransferase